MSSRKPSETSNRKRSETPSRKKIETLSRKSFYEAPGRKRSETPNRRASEAASRKRSEVPARKTSESASSNKRSPSIQYVKPRFSARTSNILLIPNHPPGELYANLSRQGDYKRSKSTTKPFVPILPSAKSKSVCFLSEHSASREISCTVCSSNLNSSKSKCKHLHKDKSVHDQLPQPLIPVQNLCGHVIMIPPNLPDILKQYAKGAMKTQPPDLLIWSGTYFRALANGDTLPVKDRLEDPRFESKDGLTPGILRVIDNQLGGKSGLKVSPDDVMKKLKGFGLKKEAFERIVYAGMSQNNSLEWDKLLAMLARTIGKDLTETMSILCQILTSQQDGFEPFVNYNIWWEMYTYLAYLSGGVQQDKIQAVNEYLLPISYANSGVIGPRDFTNSACPNLD